MKLNLLKKNLFHYVSQLSDLSEKIKKMADVTSHLLPWLQEEVVSIAEVKVNTHVHATLIELQHKLKVFSCEDTIILFIYPIVQIVEAHLEQRRPAKEESVQLFKAITSSLVVQDIDNMSIQMRAIELLWNDLSDHVFTTMNSLTTACSVSKSYEPSCTKLLQWISDTHTELRIWSSLLPDTQPINEVQIKVDVS